MSKYSNCSTLGIGCTIWNDAKRTSLYRDGYLSDGTTYYRTDGAFGVIYETGACPVFYPKIGATGISPTITTGTNNITDWKNFNFLPVSITNYNNLKISYNGQYIALSPLGDDKIVFSSNGGQSFSNILIKNMRGDNDFYYHSIVGIAMSANASTIAVLTNYAHTANTNYPRHYLLISQDYGATWTQSYEEVNNEGYWGTPQGIAMSGDGYYITTFYKNGKIRLNSQRGYSLGWTTKSFSYILTNNQNSGLPSFSKGAISFDGKYMLITCDANSNGYYSTYLSTNYGTNITRLTYGGYGIDAGLVQTSVDMSYGGKYSIYTDSDGNTWFSNDFFSSASTVNLNQTIQFKFAAMNHDGSLMAGIERSIGEIYRFDSNLDLLYPYVNTNITNGNWTSIAVAKGSAVPVVIEGNSTSGCQANGTYLVDYCDGYSLYYTYADGNCGTYDTLIESNSATCGYVVNNYYCDCGYGCDPYPNPCYYYSCNECPAP